MNRKQRIAEYIRDITPISRADIARKLEISPSTAGRIVEEMISQQVIYEGAEFQPGRLGSPAIGLHLNSHLASIIAVDLRLMDALAVIVDLDGNVMVRERKQLRCDSAEHSIADLLQLLRALLKQKVPVPVRAIVVGVPAAVDPSTGDVISAPSLCWRSLPLGRIIADELGLPVKVENDVNLAALGEFWKGSARGKRHAVTVSVGSGIGAGIIIDGEIYRGSMGAAGEVSYFIADMETLRHNASEVGALEKRIARDGVIRRARLVAQRYPASALARHVEEVGSALRANEIFTLAVDGDLAAKVVFNETVDLLTIVVHNLAAVLDPEVIVLGGPSDWHWKEIVSAIKERMEHVPAPKAHVTYSTLLEDGVVMGAAAIALRLDGVLPK